MRIALTGGTGFVGQALLELMANQHEFRGITRDVTRAKANHQTGDWIQGDLGSDGWQEALLENCDAVVHSGLYRTTESFQGNESDILEYLRVNFMGTIKLIEAARAAGVKRFIFLSTCAVHQRILDDRILDEAHPLWAENHYGAHKAALEKFIHSYGYGMGYEICALRPTGIYGLQSPVEKTKWHELIRRVASGKDVSVARGGKEVHVRDVARAIELLLKTEDAIAGEAYSCFDRYISEFDVASLAKELTGSTSEISGEQKTPKHSIETGKIRKLGMSFGGESLLRETIAQILDEISAS